MKLGKKYNYNNITSQYFMGPVRLTDFSKLSDEEKKTLYAFSFIMAQTGRPYGYDYRFQNYGRIGGYCIYKDVDVWQTYIVERNEIFAANSYDTLYDACMNMFFNFDLKTTRYALENFPKLVEQNWDMDVVNTYLNKITENFNNRHENNKKTKTKKR